MKNFAAFRQAIERELFSHPVIQANAYTGWFKRGLAEEAQIRDLVAQFAVFSNHFIVLQAKRMVHAGSLEAERLARFILVSELGVGLDPRTGSAEGRTFRTGAAHINWLRRLGGQLGLQPARLGRWETGWPSTHAFLEGLDRTYGSRDGRVGAAASFAIETWAAFGLGRGPELEARNFWRELIDGLEGHNRRLRLPNGLKPLDASFFRGHLALESGHGAGVWRELEEAFGEPGFDPELFLQAGREALEAIHTFWLGLEERRAASAARPLGSRAL